MARGRYPSDERRRDPYAKVYLRARSHPRTADAFADPEIRGIIVGLWMLGQAAHAGERGDRLILTHADVHWLTKREQLRAGLARLRRACDAVSYPISQEGESIIVDVSNLAENQRSAPRTPPEDSVHSAPPKHRSTEAQKRVATHTQKAADDELFAGNESDQLGDGRPLMNAIAKLPGSQGEKEHWVADEWVQVVADAQASREGPKPQTVQSLAIRYYRNYLRGERRYENASTLAEAAARRESERAFERQVAAEVRAPPSPELFDRIAEHQQRSKRVGESP